MLFAAIAAGVLTSGCFVRPEILHSRRQQEGRLPVTITRTNYHGWPGSIVMRGGGTEVFIVPAIGRIMQFQFAGEPGPFWENRALDGQVHPPQVTNWINFGGDKTWPAPEADWSKPFGGWLPPAAFDSMPIAAKIERDQVILTSPIDPEFGIRTVRRVFLGPSPGQMTVSTRYEKVRGPARPVSVWTITQLQEPVLAAGFVRHLDQPRFTNGFHPLISALPPDVKSTPSRRRDGDFITLTRHPKAAHKIGLAGNEMVWIGEKTMLRVSQWPRPPAAETPDHGSRTEIYTNPDPLKYIELETLGPLQAMKSGDVITWQNTYSLLRRQHVDPMDDLNALFR